MTDERRTQILATGFAALEKALAIDPDYLEALTYVNLLHREQARAFADAGDRDGYDREMQAADETVRKALEARQKRQAGERPPGP